MMREIIIVHEPNLEAMTRKYNLFPPKYDSFGRRKGGMWSDHSDKAVHVDYVGTQTKEALEASMELKMAKDIANIEGANKIYVHIIR